MSVETRTSAQTDAAGPASWTDLVADPRLGADRAVVVRVAETGETLFDLRGAVPSRTASVLKVVTSAAALTVLGPSRRLATRVLEGTVPGELVLVGGGDVTLCGLPTGTDALYPGAAHVDELARRTARVLGPGRTVHRVVLDDTLFGGPGWLPSWGDSAYERLNDGATPIISALMVDADRSDPLDRWAPRGDDPTGAAGRTFAAALEDALQLPAGTIVCARGTAADHARELARVESATVYELVRQGLIESDNAIMESLARHIGVARGVGNTAADGAAAVTAVIAGFGIDTSGVRIMDGSGLSDENAVPPVLLTELLRLALARRHGLGMLHDLLPVSGRTMSDDRFQGPNAVVGQDVRAKTGWINGTRTLAGIVRARDGVELAFAVFACGDIDESAKQAIDAVVAGAHARGADRSAYA